MTRERAVVAIDGPAGAGKSTVARKLAQRLGFMLVDTGALYRGIALCAQERGLDLSDGPGLGQLAESCSLTFTEGEDGQPRLWLDGVDRSTDIRTQAVAESASRVSRHPQVRDALLALQRRLGAAGGVVLEGRDIGTVVFPDADVKIFLTADAETRARRRLEDLRALGQEADLQQTLQDLQSRDKRDESRPVAPLRPATDAIRVDTSGLDVETVVTRLARLVESSAG